MIAVAGGKGGCGKTTTTLGLAAALVRQRKSVVAADADNEMPNLHAMAGVTRAPGLDAVAEGWPARMVAVTADAPTLGVEVLPAASGPRVAEPSHVSNSSDTGMAAALTRVRGCADTVLLDCPAGAGPDATLPLRVADAVVVVTTAEPACLRDAAKTAAMAREIGTPVAGAVVSRTEDLPEGIARLLDCPVLGVVPDAGIGTGGKARWGPRVRNEPGVQNEVSSPRNPLVDDRVRAGYDRLLSSLQPKYL